MSWRKQPENVGDGWGGGNHQGLVIFWWDEEIQKQCGWIKQVQLGLKCEGRRRQVLRTRLLIRVLAPGHCGIRTSIYEWKAVYPNFSSTHNSENWIVLDVEALWPFLLLFAPPGTSESVWTLSHSKLSSCHTVRTRKPPNLDYFRPKRRTYILSHLACFMQVLYKCIYSYLEFIYLKCQECYEIT